MNICYEAALAELTKYGQEHILKFYNELSESEKMNLYTQICNIDFELMEMLFEQAKNGETSAESVIEPIDYTDEKDISQEERASYVKRGEECIKAGVFAAVTMAGGQGTRLGHDGPKGTYSIGLPNGESLFELQAIRLLSESQKAGRFIPWYIMTSKENDSATRAFFEEKNYFGYDKESIRFFVQRMLPMLDFNGKVILDEKGHIKEGADGHGGIFAAMITSGVYADMQKRGIKWIFVGGIDNVLLKLCDTFFIGFVDASGMKMGAKSLVKRDAKEGVGIFCKADGKPYVVEYTEISEEMANARNEKGEFIYGDGHILCNMFNIEAFDAMTGEMAGLPYHVAVKKTKYVNEFGEIVTPEKPNAYKFEAFIFDAFKYFDDMAILRVCRENEFAPVKNKEGLDSPETARSLYLDAQARGMN